MFDVVVIVGALSVAQVPVGVVRELCQSTKPGKHINFFLTSRQLLLHCLFVLNTLFLTLYFLKHQAATFA